MLIKKERATHSLCTLLVFLGLDCAGTFYNSTSRIQLDLGEEAALSEAQPRMAGILCLGK